MDPEELLDGHAVATAVYERLRSCLTELGPFEIRTSKSQLAFRRRRGFAYLWLPGQYLEHPQAELVLSIVLGRQDPSARFKEVVHPSPQHWMHHLELHGPDDVDDEVLAWLREAIEHAS
jgi:hypothetical protein